MKRGTRGARRPHHRPGAAPRRRTLARRAGRPGDDGRRARRAARAPGARPARRRRRSSAAARSPSLAAACDETDVDLVIFDNELTPAQLRQIEARLDAEGHRSHAAHSRHLRVARAHARRQAAGRAGAAEVPAAAPGRAAATGCRGSAAASARAGPGETKLETDRRKIRQRISHVNGQLEEVRRRRLQLRERRHKASVPTVALVGYTNAGKTTLFNLLAGEHAVGVGRAVRDARSARPPGAAARPPRAARVGHRRLHRPAAAHAGGGVPRDARGGRRGRSAAARDRRRHAGRRAPRWRPCRRTLEEVGAGERAVDRRLQQVRPARRRRAAAARSAASPTPCASRRRRASAARSCSTRSPPGWRSTSAASSSKLDLSRDADRQRLAQLYRFGRVLSTPSTTDRSGSRPTCRAACGAGCSGEAHG